MFKVGLSPKSIALGTLIVVGALVVAAIAFRDAASNQAETLLEGRLGSTYVLVVGIASVGLAVYFGRGLLLAWPHRDSVVSIDAQAVEIQTIRGRRRVSRREVASVAYDARTRSLVVATIDGRQLRPLLRPKGATWAEVGDAMGSVLQET